MTKKTSTPVKPPGHPIVVGNDRQYGDRPEAVDVGAIVGRRQNHETVIEQAGATAEEG